MKEKDLMGTMSPAYGMMTGHGAFGQMADSGLGGVIPTMLSQERKKKKDGTPMTEAEAAASPAMKKGGSVSPNKKMLAKSGFYDKDTTKSEREKIVNKVTTKPQRVKMVEKMLSTKKMKSGGTVSPASKRADGIAMKGKTKGRMI
jgi:hypothetical protein